MNFWINRQGNSEGPFPLEELQSRLNSGELAPTDLACPEGGNAWQSVAEVLTSLVVMPPMPPATPPPRRRALLIGGAVVLVLGLVAAAIFLFGGGRSLPKTAKYVPKESVAVVTTYFGDLLGKADVEELLNKGMLKQMDVPTSMRGQMKDLIGNAEKTGLDLSEPIFFFVLPPLEDSNEPRFGATFPLKSRDDFIKALTELAGDDADLKEAIQKLKQEGVLQPDREVVMAINDDVFLIVGGDVRYGAQAPNFSDLAKKILKGDNGLPDADKTFVTHQETMFDVGGWVNLTSVLRTMGPKTEEDLEVLGDLGKLGKFHITAGLLFEKGEVVVDAGMFYDEKLLGNWGGGGLDSELLDAVPDDSLMAFSQSMDLSVLKEWFAERPGLKGNLEKELQSEFKMSINDALDAFGGDVVIAFTRLETKRNRYGNEIPDAEILFGATIKNKGQVEKLLAKLKEAFGEGAPFRLVIRDDAIFICSPDEQSALSSKGKVAKPLDGDKRDLLGENDSAIFIDGERIGKVLELYDRDAAEAMKDFGGSGLFTITLDAKDGAQLIRARMPMPKDDENSLKQIIDAGIRATLGED